MTVNINDLLNKSIQMQQVEESQTEANSAVTNDLSAFAINLENASIEQSIDMSNFRAALGAGMAINTVLEARHQAQA